MDLARWNRKQKQYLDALHQKAFENPKKPFMGYREIARKTKTSTRTFHKYLPQFLEKGVVRVTREGKWNKYYLTERGEQYLDELKRQINHSDDLKEMMMSKDARFLVVEDSTSKIGATVYYEPSLAFSEGDKKKIRKHFNSFLEQLQRDYPDKKIRAILTSNPETPQRAHRRKVFARMRVPS